MQLNNNLLPELIDTDAQAHVHLPQFDVSIYAAFVGLSSFELFVLCVHLLQGMAW